MPDIVTGKIFVDGEKGITATKMNQIIGQAVIQPDFYNNKPSSSTLDPTDTLLELKSTNTYAQITGAQLISSVSGQVSVLPQILSTRLRSFNANGNCTFEIDQKLCGTAATLAAGSTSAAVDRWLLNKTAATGVVTMQQMAGPVLLPGTNFAVSSKFLRITVTTVQSTLAAGDFLFLGQVIEGQALRELIGDVHSQSILVRSSVAGLQFGWALLDGAATPTQTLTNLCTIPSASTWTLIQLPNLPVWPAGGTFPITPGVAGYLSRIVLAAGSNWTNAANATWQSAYKMGAVGQGNFLNGPINSTLDIAYIGHEPGNICTNPVLDVPFQKSLDECQRYFTKSYPYATKPGTASISAGSVRFQAFAGMFPNNLYAPFKKTMAKAPTVTGYSTTSGASNTVRDEQAAADKTISGTQGAEDSGFGGFSISSANAANWYGSFHYIADTGW